MKNLDNYITERLKLTGKTEIINYAYYPKTKEELKKLVNKLIKERGNEADLNDIDVSEITNMSWLFYDVWHFNGDISKWNVSNVKDMSNMFKDAPFDGDISNWDVSNVEYMDSMFMNSYFTGKNGDISKWDVSKVKNMDFMFYHCPLEKNPPKWYKK